MFGSNKDYITESALIDFLAPLNKRIDALEKTVAAQRKQIEELLQQRSETPPTLPELTVTIAKQTDEADSLPQAAAATPQLHSNEDTCYFSAPTADGVFQQATPTMQSGSIYELSTADGINGHYRVLSTPDAIAMAMISVSQFVKPACRIEGSTHRQARSIVTLDEGVAKKEGEEWRVVKKATVRFE